MGSPIPLVGLCHRVDIKRRADADDGSGGVALGTSTDIYLGRRSRVTVMTDRDEAEGFGLSSGQHWQVLLKYSPLVAKSDFINLSATSKAAPIPTGQVFRVLWVKHQVDHLGRFHHSSIVMELADTEQ